MCNVQRRLQPAEKVVSALENTGVHNMVAGAVPGFADMSTWVPAFSRRSLGGLAEDTGWTVPTVHRDDTLALSRSLTRPCHALQNMDT